MATDVFAEGSELLGLVLEPRSGYGDVSRSWMRFAWSHLARAGVVPLHVDDVDVQYVDHAVTLISLAWIAQSFEDVAGGGFELDGVPVPDVVRAGGVGRPWFSEIELGRYCERELIFAEWYPETSSSLMEAAIADRVPVVKAALVKQVGETALFVSLVELSHGQLKSGQDIQSQPETFPSDLVDEVVNDLHIDRSRAWDWLTLA